MVKPDVKHNYYADLDLPTSASLDDIRKSYRKLALQYHPDRNSGREDECVPKFQAIQAANEVLGDPATKQKYDNDRRKVGSYPTGPTFNPRQPAPGNPYAANSAYPPPPRRTQPGTWQRPTPAGGVPPGPAPNGADRFSHFPRPSPTARKDPAQDRANMFRAWQNMNSTQDRPPRNFAQTGPQPAPQPQSTRQRPQPPPRPEPKMPTEDQIRAGMKYRNVPQFDAEGADQRQTAWSSFQQSYAGKTGMGRSTSTRTPRKGFNPNAPGSDEKAYPGVNSKYFHRNRSTDFGTGVPGAKVPPPPPGPPPSGATPTTPLSPVSPTSRRPFADPPRPFNNRGAEEQVPYSEGNRKRTPYTSFIGERTDFSNEGLRRSYSHRDTTKLGADSESNRSRARSTSTLGRERAGDEQTQPNTQKKPFVVYSSSEASDSSPNLATPADDMNNSNTQRPGTAPNVDGPFGRPKKVPTPPSTRFNGTRGGPTSPPPMPAMPPHMNGATADGAQSEGEQPGMRQKSKSNMYADPPLPCSSPESWMVRMFGSKSTSRASSVRPKIPKWAIPSSLNPSLKREQNLGRGTVAPSQKTFVTGADQVFINATKDEQSAFFRFQTELEKEYGCVPDNLDMDIFLKLASTARHGTSSSDQVLDRLLRRVLRDFSSINYSQNRMTDEQLHANSFTFPHDDFTSNNAKSRSEENINTEFSPDGWSGQFTGEPDYFAPPPPTGKKQASPTRRPASQRSAKEQPRSATMDVPPPASASNEEIPQRPWGSDGTPRVIPPNTASADGRFSEDEWKKTFSDASWSFPPKGQKPPSPTKSAATGGARKPSQGRRASKAANKGATAAKQQHQQPHVLDADDTVEFEGADGQPEHGASTMEDGDAMDIDSTPPAPPKETPAQGTPTQANEKEARVYSVPPSAWRQQQEQRQKQGNSHRKSSSAFRRAQRAPASEATKLDTSLDDLRNVLPIGKAGDSSGGLHDLSDMNSTLPFQSQASTTLPTYLVVPRRLEIPRVPCPPVEPTKLSKASWQEYVRSFGEYLRAFHEWNGILIAHFCAREKSAEARFMRGSGWLEAAGETSGNQGQPAGFASYAQAVREDEGVREGWNVGSEQHAEAVKGFEKLRERVRKLAGTGALTES